MGYGFLQDDKGNNSATRLVMIFVFATFSLSYLALTFARVWKGGDLTMLDIPMGVTAFGGLVWIGKEVQKAIENKGPQGGAP